MVQFNSTSYSVTIETGTNPIEEWLELQSEILGVLAVLDMQQLCMPMPFRLINLLRDMQPDLQVAWRMVK